MVQIDDLYKRVVIILPAKSESGGQFVEYSGFKRRGDWIDAVNLIKQMSSDLNI